MSPTIHQEDGYSFYFFSFDAQHEPPHIHVSYGRPGASDAKFWLDPISIANTGRFRSRDLRRMRRIVEENCEQFLKEWYAYRRRL